VTAGASGRFPIIFTLWPARIVAPVLSPDSHSNNRASRGHSRRHFFGQLVSSNTLWSRVKIVRQTCRPGGGAANRARELSKPRLGGCGSAPDEALIGRNEALKPPKMCFR